MTDEQSTDLKLSIFHSIISHRDLTAVEAAEATEKVYQKLCIPQAPSA